jgi:hypothetical protein
MKDLFVSYEQAIQLKELGFDELCLKVGNPNGHILWKFMDVLDVEGVDIGDIMKEKFDNRFVEIPLKQQVYVWFIEKQGLSSWILSITDPKETDTKYSYKIKNCDDELLFDNLEDAEDACINKLIEILKQK